eukprot:3967071-Prymnesium_polylepis.1
MEPFRAASQPLHVPPGAEWSLARQLALQPLLAPPLAALLVPPLARFEEQPRARRRRIRRRQEPHRACRAAGA